jgi:predicted nucleic acid-binding Zn finger protein
MSKDLLFDIYLKAKNKDVIDEELISLIDSMFPGKVEKVLEVIKKGITKYYYKPSDRVVWVALGKNCEHMIYPRLYCSCQDFYKNVVIVRNRNFCKHLVAQAICEGLNDFNELELDDEDFDTLVEDLNLKF